MPLSHIPARTDYVDEVYKALLDAITTGALAPGERVTQDELAEKLNVSRSPILQALRVLKKEGLFEEAPGRGLLVSRLDPVRIGHLYRVRGAMDALAARLAAEAQAQMSPALIQAGRAAAAGHDVRAMIDADIAFHTAIYEASDNPYIVDTSALHWVHLRRVMGAVLQNQASRAGIWDEHAAIAAAIQAGDSDLAAKLSEGHSAMAQKNLIGGLTLA